MSDLDEVLLSADLVNPSCAPSAPGRAAEGCTGGDDVSEGGDYAAPTGALCCDALCFGTHPEISKATGVVDYPSEEWLPGARPKRLLPVWWLAFQQWAGWNPLSGLIDNYILPLQIASLSPDGKYSDLGLASSVGTFAAFGKRAHNWSITQSNPSY